MIVFWRLFLALVLTDFICFTKSLYDMGKESRLKALAIRSLSFAILATAFCWNYLSMQWPFLEEVLLPGWLCILLFALFYGFTDYYFQFGGKVKYGYTLSFFVKNAVNILFLVLISPFQVLYETGNFFAESWVVFCAGLMIVMHSIGWFVFSVEQDKYGRDFPTFDEQWMLALMRVIFFLIMLLPGLRWAFFLIIWFCTCLYARRIRLLDVPGWVFTVCVVGSVFIGFLIRLRFYLVD